MVYVHKTTTLVTGFIIDGEEKIGFLGVHIHLRWSGLLLEVEEKNPEPGGLNGPLIPVEVRVSPLNFIRHVMLCSGSACHTIQYMQHCTPLYSWLYQC